MALATKLLFAGLLICFLSSFCAAGFLEGFLEGVRYGLTGQKTKYQQTIEKYRVETSSTYSLGSNKTAKKIILDAYIQPANLLGNVLAVAFKNVQILVTGQSGQTIDVAKCMGSATLKEDFERPFLMTYDITGVLSNVKLGRKEDSLSANLKLLGASIMQFNLPQLVGLSPKVTERKELTLEGTCLINKEATQKFKNGSYLLSKKYNVAACSEVASKSDSEKSNGLTCLSNTCNSAGKRDLAWNSESNIQIQFVNNHPEANKANIKQELTYSPFKDQKTRLRFDLNVDIKLLSNDFAQKDITAHGKVLINKQVRNPINKNICSGKEANIDNDLAELYSAIQCEQPFAAFYGAIIEKAVECSSDY